MEGLRSQCPDGDRIITQLYINHYTAIHLCNATTNGLVQAVRQLGNLCVIHECLPPSGRSIPERATPQAKRKGVQSPRSGKSLFDESGATCWLIWDATTLGARADVWNPGELELWG